MGKKTPQRIVFDRGVDTVIEDVLTPNGGLSTSQNTRQRHPGIEQRSGHNNLFNDDVAVASILRIHQYIDRNDTKHFLRQAAEGEIDRADDNPPTNPITGWTEKLGVGAGIVDIVPASFSKVRDTLVISDATRQHQIFSGETARIRAFISYKGVGEITAAVWGGTLNAGLNDATSGGTYVGTSEIPRYYKIQVDTTGTPDSFDWFYSIDNRGTWNVGASSVAITGGAQTLDNGVTVTFGATTGHAVTDIWFFEAHAIDIVPEEGEDYTFQVNDKRVDTFAEIDSLGILTEHDALFICTQIPASKITLSFVSSKVSDQTSAMSAHYWKDVSGSYGWTAVGSLSDGTSSGGISLAQDGNITWDSGPTNEAPHYMFGKNGFWYRLTFSAAIGSDVQVRECSYESAYQQIQNIWNGVPQSPAEVMIEQAGDDIQKMFKRVAAATSINLRKFPAGDYIYIHSIDRIVGFYIDPGGTPNIISAKVTDLQILDGGTGEDTLVSTKREFSREGFVEGMDVVTEGFSGDAANNTTFNIRSVSTSIIKSPTGIFGIEETDSNAIITYNKESFIEAVEYFDGNSWIAVSNVVDGTRGLSRHGFVTWQRNDAHKAQFKQSIFHSYVYRFKMNEPILANINISLEIMPYFDIDEISFGVCNGAWKQRAVYSNGNQFAFISGRGAPLRLNGSDFAVMEAGDGRSNMIVAFRTFYNELIAWQEEDAEAGGCTTLFEGFSPATFGKVVLSTKIGCLNAKCATVVDGSTAFVSTRDRVQTIAIWLSRYGVYMTDGRVVTNISNQIHNFFNPLKNECINISEKNKMWLDFDSSERVIRIGLVTGTSTSVDIFPVLDIDTFQWSFDVFPSGSEPGCFTEVVPLESGSTTKPLIQIVGGAADSTIKQSNIGLNDENASGTVQAVDCLADLEFDGQGGIIVIDRLYFREKAQGGNTTIRIKKSTNVDEVFDSTLPRVASQASDGHRRIEFTRLGIKSDHLTIRFRNKELGSSMYMLDATFMIESEDGYSE